MSNLARRRAVPGCTESCRAGEWPHGWLERVLVEAEGNVQQSKYADGRKEGNERSHSWGLVVLVLVRCINQDEARRTIGMFGCKNSSRQTTDRCSDEDHRSADAGAIEKLPELARHPA
jgi:hypothetical protein